MNKENTLIFERYNRHIMKKEIFCFVHWVAGAFETTASSGCGLFDEIIEAFPDISSKQVILANEGRALFYKNITTPDSDEINVTIVYREVDIDPISLAQRARALDIIYRTQPENFFQILKLHGTKL